MGFIMFYIRHWKDAMLFIEPSITAFNLRLYIQCANCNDFQKQCDSSHMYQSLVTFGL